MNSNNDLDNLWAGPEHDDVLADDAFVHAVMIGVERHRNRRRVMLGVAAGVAGMIACVLLIVLPAPALSGAPLGAFDVLATLVLVAFCGMAWIASEDAAVAA